jgi:hypothetical protein
MSDQTGRFADGSDLEARWQAQLLASARVMPYPPTPDLVARLRPQLAGSRPARRMPAGVRRNLAWALAIALIILAILLTVPSVRAAVVKWLQIGSVRIYVGATATPIIPATPTQSRPGPNATPPAPSATPGPSPASLQSVLDLAGQTTLAQARSLAGFTIRLPAYPADLGQPDLVYLQDLGGPAVILVWLKPGQPTQVRLSLFVLSAPYIADKLIYGAMKSGVPGVQTTQVNGNVAVWTTGPYVLHTRNGSLQEYRLIQGHVLIWTDGVLTYRLETDQSLDEAVRVAESLGK